VITGLMADLASGPETGARSLTCSLHIIRQPSSWSLTATFAERIKDALSSLLPS